MYFFDGLSLPICGGRLCLAYFYDVVRSCEGGSGFSFFAYEFCSVKLGGFQDSGGFQLVFICPQVVGASPGVGTLIEIHARGMVKLTEAVDAGLEELDFEFVNASSCRNFQGVGGEGDIADDFIIQ